MSTIASQTRPIPAPRSWIARHPLVAYFLIAFAGTWVVILPLVLASSGVIVLPDALSFLFFIAAAYTGPMLAALVVTGAAEGEASTRRLLRRIVQWRVGFFWYLAAVFSALLVWLVAYSLLYAGAPLGALLANPSLLVSMFLPNLLLGLFIPSLGEETGWRGFALPRLQAAYGPLLGTLILGLLHSLWHFPAFFTPFLGPFSPERFLAFVLTGTAGSFIFTWVFNGARGSILLAILTHAAFNAASSLMGLLIPTDAALPPALQPLVPDWINVIAFGAAALLLVATTRGRLRYQG